MSHLLPPLFLLLTSNVHEGEIDITQIPVWLGAKLGIDPFSAGILASIILLFIVTLPIIILTKGKSVLATLLFGLSTLGFCVTIGWFPAWFLIVLCLSISIALSKQLTHIFGGE